MGKNVLRQPVSQMTCGRIGTTRRLSKQDLVPPTHPLGATGPPSLHFPLGLLDLQLNPKQFLLHLLLEFLPPLEPKHLLMHLMPPLPLDLLPRQLPGTPSTFSASMMRTRTQEAQGTSHQRFPSRGFP